MKRGYKCVTAFILALLICFSLISIDAFASELNIPSEAVSEEDNKELEDVGQGDTQSVEKYDFSQDGSGKNISPEEDDSSDAEAYSESPRNFLIDGSNQQIISYLAGNMSVSQTGVDLIKQFEGCRLTAYKATSSEQYYTIGYGHYGPDVYAGMTITQEQAESMLKTDLVTYAGYVNTFLNKYGITVNQNQFDALTSFTYNVGNVWVSYDTFQLKTYLINGVSNYTDAQITTAFTNWNKSGGVVLEGLTRRRQAEAKLFLTGMPDICNCSTSYAGNYTCTSNTTLNIRSGHGTGYSVIGSIPSGATVYVSKADGTWAHVTYNGISGYASMQYLSKQEDKYTINLHVWVSDTKMGDVPSTFIKGTMYYLCYELVDTNTGKKLNEDHGNLNYTVTEEITKPDGSTALYSAYQTISGTTSAASTVKAPSAVTGLKIGGRATDALRLNWDKNSSASGYIIEQYKNGAWTRIARIGTNGTTTYRVEGLSASTTYQFRVKTFGFSGNTPLYSAYKNISGTTLPTAVTGLKIGGTASDALRLNWNKNSKASGYIVEQFKNGEWVRIARIGDNSTVTYRVEKLQPSTSYVFRVQCFGFDGSTPLYSSYQTVSGTTNK